MQLDAERTHLIQIDVSPYNIVVDMHNKRFITFIDWELTARVTSRNAEAEDAFLKLESLFHALHTFATPA